MSFEIKDNNEQAPNVKEHLKSTAEHEPTNDDTEQKRDASKFLELENESKVAQDKMKIDDTLNKINSMEDQRDSKEDTTDFENYRELFGNDIAIIISREQEAGGKRAQKINQILQKFFDKDKKIWLNHTTGGFFRKMLTRVKAEVDGFNMPMNDLRELKQKKLLDDFKAEVIALNAELTM
ncbi:MAG TPA: hypothetical protein ENJ27_00175 [Candidatus Moranbacteria bacterium]|nr:hypothetical protein [Candidatus Moranbacteria bacterium]